MTATRTRDLDLDLDAVVEKALAEYGVPGMTVGILDGRERTLGAWGIANVETGGRMTPETVQQIGSISKIFTATLLMELVEAGLVDLDRPVRDVLPEFRLADRKAQTTVTLRHCLTHVTGFDGDRFDDHGRGDDALAVCVAGYRTLRQQLPPGTAFSYCNTGFNVVGRVIEHVLDMPFEQAMKERVFDPLGMPRSTYFADEAILMAAAAGHLRKDDQNVVARPYPLARNANPAGGIIADVNDLLTFAAAHLGLTDVPSPFPRPETLRLMREPQVRITGTTSRGLGWLLETRGDEQIVSHGGATNGFKASLVLLPDRGSAIASLTNGDMGIYANRDVERAILHDRFGIVTDDPEPIPAEAGLAERLRGQYDAMLSELTIDGDDEGLTFSIVSINPFTGERSEPSVFPVAPISSDELMATEAPRRGTTYQLLPDDDGKINMVRAGGRIAVRHGTAPAPGKPRG